MVENPDSITEFEEQDEGENVTAETVSENSNIMNDFVEKTQNLIKNNSLTAALDVVNNATLPNILSQTTFNNLAKSVFNSVKDFGLQGTYELIDDKINNLLGGNLAVDEIELIRQELVKIPDAIVDTALRI